MKIRTIFVIGQFPPSSGGAERQAHILAKTLTKKGMTISVLTGNHGIPCNYQDNHEFPVYRINNRFRWHFRKYHFGFKVFLMLIKFREKYDIIHAHELNYLTFFAYMAALLLKKPLLVKVGNSGYRFDLRRLRYSILGGWLMLKILTWSDIQFVATTNVIKEELKSFRVKGESIIKIPNGVIIFNKRTTKTAGDISKQLKDICAIGSLTEKKNYKKLIEACEILKKMNTVFHLKIAGSGPLKNKLISFSEKLGVTENITFAGELNREQINELIVNSDIFVLPSLTEGFSNALLEALSGGLIPVVSRVPSNMEILTGLTEEHFFDPNDPYDIAKKLASFLGKECQNHKVNYINIDGFDINNVADKYIQLYEKLLFT